MTTSEEGAVTSIEIVVNEKKKIVDKGINLINLFEIIPEVKSHTTVSVKINEKYILQENFEKTILKEGDNVHHVFFMGGSS